MTATTRSRRPAKPKFTELEQAAIDRARSFLRDPTRPGVEEDLAWLTPDAEVYQQDAAALALAVLVHHTDSPDPVVDDPLVVIGREIPPPPAWEESRDTGMYAGLAEALKARLTETETIPVVAGELEPTADLPAWATTRQWLPPVEPPRRRRLFGRQREEERPWPY